MQKNILALYRYREFCVGIFYFASPCSVLLQRLLLLVYYYYYYYYYCYFYNPYILSCMKENRFSRHSVECFRVCFIYLLFSVCDKNIQIYQDFLKMWTISHTKWFYIFGATLYNKESNCNTANLSHLKKDFWGALLDLSLIVMSSSLCTSVAAGQTYGLFEIFQLFTLSLPRCPPSDCRRLWFSIITEVARVVSHTTLFIFRKGTIIRKNK